MPPTLEQTLLTAWSQAGFLGLRQACAAHLARARALDPPGQAAVLEQDQPLASLLAQAATAGEPQRPALARELAARLDWLGQARQCLACGTCCRASGPTLYLEDLPLLGEPGLGKADLLTLRAGERAHSARLGQVLVLEQELIKLRWTQDGACRNLRGSLCAVYEHRPRQCRQLECWSGRHAGQLEGLPRLSRAGIYAQDSQALALMAEYDLRLPARQVAQALEQAAGGGDVTQAQALLELDARLRAGASGRYGYALAELDLLWGRPVWQVAVSFGLETLWPQGGPPQLGRRG